MSLLLLLLLGGAQAQEVYEFVGAVQDGQEVVLQDVFAAQLPRCALVQMLLHTQGSDLTLHVRTLCLDNEEERWARCHAWVRAYGVIDGPRVSLPHAIAAEAEFTAVDIEVAEQDNRISTDTSTKGQSCAASLEPLSGQFVASDGKVQIVQSSGAIMQLEPSSLEWPDLHQAIQDYEAR